MIEASIGRLAALRFPRELGIAGPTGIGKTTVINSITRSLRDRGWLVARFDLRPRIALSAQIINAVLQSIQARGGRNPIVKARRRRGEIRASARIPFTPIEIQYETGSDSSVPAAEIDPIRPSILEYLENGTPVVIVIDEGDFLTGQECEDVILPMVGNASTSDLPLWVVTTGIGHKFLGALGGESTYGSALGRGVWLERFDDATSRNLLLATAQLGGEDWSSIDLSEAIRLCKGIPRRLQEFGSTVFCSQNELGIERAVLEGVADLKTRLRSVRWTMSPGARAIFEASIDMLGSSAETMDYFYDNLEITINNRRVRFREDEHSTYLWSCLYECERSGVLQVGPEFVELLAPRL